MKAACTTIAVFIIFSLLSIHPAAAQTARLNINRFTNGKGDTLNYRLLFPDADTMRKYPLVIFLHGSGERGTDNEAQLKWGVMNFTTDKMMAEHPIIVIAPQCPPNMQWWNARENKRTREIKINPAPSKPIELAIALVQQLIKTMPVDTN